MAAVSQFSTAENYKKLQDALTKTDHAIQEAQLAVQAGIPQADTMLKAAEETRKRVQQLLDTYFPGGAVPAGS